MMEDVKADCSHLHGMAQDGQSSSSKYRQADHIDEKDVCASTEQCKPHDTGATCMDKSRGQRQSFQKII